MGNIKKVTVRTLAKMKAEGTPIAMLTAYDYPSAKICDAVGVDILLVGDSLGNTVLGYESTVPVTLEDVLHHTKAVTRGTQRAFVVADMPFLTSHLDRKDVLLAAGKLMQEGGAKGVKMEGGEEIVDHVLACTRAGIPVMGHLGLLPQTVHQLGGYRVQGRDEESAQKLLREAKLLQEAGIFALVLECVPEEVASQVTSALQIPVIGIGAGRYCDGQVLVFHDILQLGSTFQPSFVKTYAQIGEAIAAGVRDYVDEVRNRQFPEEQHVFRASTEMIRKLYGGEGEGDGANH